MEKPLINFDLKFTGEQEAAREVCHNNTVTILTGKPGTSKTTIAASIAMELVIRGKKPTSQDTRLHGDYRKIIVSRPTVEAGKSIGLLPGDEKQKLGPYTAPVLDVMTALISPGNSYSFKTEKWLEEGKLEMVPLQFMRGKTFNNCIVILDEGQNADLEQFKLIATRIGRDCKLIVTSDWRQVDLFDRKKSASQWYEKIMGLNGVGSYELTENFRSPLAIEIMDLLMDESKR